MIAGSRARGRLATPGVPAVTPLRLLALRAARPADFATALSMEANLAVLRTRDLWAYLERYVMEPIMEMELEGVTREEVEAMVGILLTNAFEVQVRESLLFGLFFEPALMNHHCVGNTRLMLDAHHTMTVRQLSSFQHFIFYLHRLPIHQLTLQVIASLPIKKNCQVKFNYGRALDPTLTRQAMLLENKFFSCGCERCRDPSELGSHTSTLRCSPPCDGLVLPTSPLAQAPWTCSKCAAERQAAEVAALLATVAADMEQLDRNNMKAVKQLLTKFSALLHKNNGVLVELKQILVSGIGRLPGFEMQDLREADHKEKIVLCDEVLTVLNKVEPGLSLGRGLMLFELHSSVVMVRPANM